VADVIRPAEDTDRPAILSLMRRVLGWPADERAERFWRWKHEQNPFGPSPVWVGESDGAVVAVRAFLRWELTVPGGGVLRAVRAVDTATSPEHQGRGWFRRLTLHGLDALAAEGVDLVFNTPNDASRPGYLSMGWTEQGRVAAWARPLRPAGVVRTARARVPADLWPIEIVASEALAPAVALADGAAVATALRDSPAVDGAATLRSVEYLRWRFGLDDLGYRVVVSPAGTAAGFAVVRARRRGPARELALLDVVGSDRSVVRRALRVGGCDHAVALGRRPGPMWIRARRLGPRLVARPVGAGLVPTGWALALGDVELL